MLTRRDLVQGACATVALAVVGGGASAVVGHEESLLRPPGAQNEDVLIGRCVRCDRCRSVCPTKAIGVSTVEDGLINARTPRMMFRLGYCDECQGAYRCAAVCPTGAITTFDKTCERMGVALIDPDVCLTYGVSGSCSANCIDPCPEDALEIDSNGRLVLNENLCWGCGACEYFCVSDSYGDFEATGRRGINIVSAEV